MKKNKNDITLDTIVTGVPSEKFLNNYDQIDFSVKLEPEVVIEEDDGEAD